MTQSYVVWLGPKLKKIYETTLRSPANWRMITQLAALDEKAEREAHAGHADPPDGFHKPTKEFGKPK
jgi:hypothetical protein